MTVDLLNWPVAFEPLNLPLFNKFFFPLHDKQRIFLSFPLLNLLQIKQVPQTMNLILPFNAFWIFLVEFVSAKKNANIIWPCVDLENLAQNDTVVNNVGLFLTVFHKNLQMPLDKDKAVVIVYFYI